jgi:hypothetical protein
MQPFELVQEFLAGKRLVTADGSKVAEIFEYSCAPARIDGLIDEETVAIRLEGEPPNGLTPYDHRNIRVVDQS